MYRQVDCSRAFHNFKPVHQTSFRSEDDGSRGNCFQASLASIMGLPLHGVPEFHRQFFKETWMLDVQNWLDFYGLQIHDISKLINRTDPEPLDLKIQDYYYLVSGPSPRGDWHHQCVGYKGEIVHDPYPEGTGLADGVYTYEILVPIKYFPDNIPMDLR